MANLQHFKIGVQGSSKIQAGYLTTLLPFSNAECPRDNKGPATTVPVVAQYFVLSQHCGNDIHFASQ
jgi:hypothetical protein